MGWTDERVELLKALWLQGLSASQIAKQLGGVTRNSVIGKVHRLGLTGRAQPSKPRPAQIAAKPQRRVSPPIRRAPKTPPGQVKPGRLLMGADANFATAEPLPPRLPTRAEAFDPLPGTTPLAWAERTAAMCNWPVGTDDNGPLSCAAPVERGGLCHDHAIMGFKPVRPSQGEKGLMRSLRRHLQ